MSDLRYVFNFVLQLANTRLSFGCISFTIFELWLGLFTISIISMFLHNVFSGD